MTKNITVAFENEEFVKLKIIKGKTSWHDFIVQLADEHKDKKAKRIL